jgi:adenosylcobinamide-GDP ribazoletransferase
MMRRPWNDARTALQFLTRVPVGALQYDADALSRAVVWFPLVGGLVGASAVGVHWLAAKVVSAQIAALATLIFLVTVTGAFHEDGLADTADGLGGGWTREQSLEIMRDSRIGTYGAAALVLSLLARWLLLGSLPAPMFAGYVIAAHVLCRWTTLPLSCFLPSARTDGGQGVRVAARTSRFALVAGTLIAFSLTALLLQWHAVIPLLAAIIVAALSGMYFQRRLGGVTGDCFGAANQITEIVIYLCGVIAW